MLVEFMQDAFQHDQVFLVQNWESGGSTEYDLYHQSGNHIRSMSGEDAVQLVKLIRDAQATQHQELAALIVVTAKRVAANSGT